MKRTAEFVLGIIGVLFALASAGLTYMGLSAYDNPEFMSLIGGGIDIEALKWSATVSIIATLVLAIIAIVPTVLIFKNRKPFIAAVLFLAVGAFGFPFGLWIPSVLFVIAGLLSLFRKEKKEEYHYSEE